MTEKEYKAELEKNIKEQADVLSAQRTQITDLSKKLNDWTSNIFEIQQLPVIQQASAGSNKYILYACIGFILILWLFKRLKK